MVNKSTKQKMGGGKKKDKALARMRAVAPGDRRSVATEALRKYLHMLEDPCSGTLANAPYAGSGAGYLIRTVNQISLGGNGAVGGQTTADFVCQITPYNFPAPFVGCVTNPGVDGVCNSFAINNFVTNTSIVKTYRPVAACIRFVSNGTVAGRSGLIGRTYNASKAFSVGDVQTGRNLLPFMSRVDPNGSTLHEVKWLPSFGDERFGSVSDANINGAGSMVIVGSNVDMTQTGAGGYSINGYVEVTCVWEWIPFIIGGSPSQGVVGSTPVAQAFTVQDVLSRIRDVGSFLYGGARSLNAAYQYAASTAGTLRGSAFLEY